MSEQNNSPLHKLADKIAGERPQPKPEPIDHVRAAVESFVAQKATLDRQAETIQKLEITVARLDVELETRLQDLNECRRDRDHYMAYAYTLVTQFNAVRALIDKAMDRAASEPIEPPRPNPNYPYPEGDTISIVPGTGSGATATLKVEPLPPMPTPQDAG